MSRMARIRAPSTATHVFSGRPRRACLKQDGQDGQDEQDEGFCSRPTSRLVLVVHVCPEKPLSAAEGSLLLSILRILAILLQTLTPPAQRIPLSPGHPDNPGHPASDSYTRRAENPSLSWPS